MDTVMAFFLEELQNKGYERVDSDETTAYFRKKGQAALDIRLNASRTNRPFRIYVERTNPAKGKYGRASWNKEFFTTTLTQQGIIKTTQKAIDFAEAP